MNPRIRGLALLVLPAALCEAATLELKTAGTLRVLAVPGSPQFVNLAPGALPGFDREVLDGFVAKEKLKLELVTVESWDVLLDALLEGRGDLVAGGVTVTPSRQSRVDFTVEVFPTREMVLTRKPVQVITTLEQLREEKVGTIRGTSMAEALAKVGLAPRNLDDSFPSGTLPEGLRSGRISACVLGVEDAVLAQRADPQIQLGMFLGPRESLAYAVRKEAPALRRALDAYLTNLRRTPTWGRLVVKYFGDAALPVLKRAQEN